MEKKLIQRFPTFHRVVIFLLLLLLPSIHFIPPSMAEVQYSPPFLHRASCVVAFYPSGVAIAPGPDWLCGVVLVFLSFLHPENIYFHPSTTSITFSQSRRHLLLLLPFLFPFSFVDVVSRPPPFLSPFSVAAPQPRHQ